LPYEKTIGIILNRLGYCLRQVQKAKPLKKIPETDAIFDNLININKASDLCADSLRISIDTKAKVDLCDSSRGGTSRCRKAVQANDYDRGFKDKLAPFGILNVMTDCSRFSLASHSKPVILLSTDLSTGRIITKDSIGLSGSWSSTWTMVHKTMDIERSS